MGDCYKLFHYLLSVLIHAVTLLWPQTVSQVRCWPLNLLRSCCGWSGRPFWVGRVMPRSLSAHGTAWKTTLSLCQKIRGMPTFCCINIIQFFFYLYSYTMVSVYGILYFLERPGSQYTNFRIPGSVF